MHEHRVAIISVDGPAAFLDELSERLTDVDLPPSTQLAVGSDGGVWHRIALERLLPPQGDVSDGDGNDSLRGFLSASIETAIVRRPERLYLCMQADDDDTALFEEALAHTEKLIRKFGSVPQTKTWSSDPSVKRRDRGLPHGALPAMNGGACARCQSDDLEDWHSTCFTARVEVDDLAEATIETMKVLYRDGYEGTYDDLVNTAQKL